MTHDAELRDPRRVHGSTHGSVTDLVAHGSIVRAWAEHVAADPDRPAIRDPGGTWLTRRGLQERSADLAHRLHSAGVGPGDRVVVSGPTGAAFVVAHLGVLRLRAVTVPVNPGATRREVDVVLADAEPALVLAAGADHRAAAAEAGVPALDLEAVGTLDRAGREPAREPHPRGGSEPTRPVREPTQPVLDTAGPDDPALLPYTSGTTGVPKGALLTHGNLLASAEALRRAWRWTDADRLVLALPLFHMHGLGVGLHGTLLTGGQVLLHDGFVPADVLTDAADPATTMVFGVPTMYARLVDEPAVDALASLRLCVSGSAPLSADLHRRIADSCGQIVLERYGMTETVMLASNPLTGERRPGSVGLPLPGVEIRLGPADEIEVRGPNVFGGYWRRPDAGAFTEDGWFRTGDVGAFDADGYLRIVGRAKELIITGGFNVYPREVEDVLRDHPDVHDVAVAGTPDDHWGEIVTAYVVARGAAPGGAGAGAPFDTDGLLAWAAAQLVAYKRPRLVHVVDALPRNSLGKVVRERLADLVPD